VWMVNMIVYRSCMADVVTVQNGSVK